MSHCHAQEIAKRDAEIAAIEKHNAILTEARNEALAEIARLNQICSEKSSEIYKLRGDVRELKQVVERLEQLLRQTMGIRK